MRMRIVPAFALLFASAILVSAGGAPRKEDIPKYMNMLKSASARERALAADQLGKRGQVKVTDVKEAVDPLLTILKEDKDSSVRKSAAAALGNMATEGKKTIPALVEALKDKSLDVNLAAVKSLGQFSTEAKSAIPAMRDFANAKNDKKIKQMVNTAIKAMSAQ